jgi:hypothetical protein
MNNNLLNVVDYLLDGISFIINNYLPENDIITSYNEELRNIIIEDQNINNYKFLEIPIKHLHVRDKIQKYSLTNNYLINEYEQKQYYRLYLFIILPNDIFVKLYRSTNNFVNWNIHTFDLFTFFLDLYANNIIKPNNNIDNISNFIIDKFKFKSSLIFNKDLIYTTYQNLIIELNIVFYNLTYNDLKNKIIHNDLYGIFISNYIKNI